MSDTPRSDSFKSTMAESDNASILNLDWWLFARDLERELAQEHEHSMMAGSQNSALRLQLKDAEARASSAARDADHFYQLSGKYLAELNTLKEEHSPEGVATMPAEAPVAVQELICDLTVGHDWRTESLRLQARCKSEAVDLYNAIRAACLPQQGKA